MARAVRPRPQTLGLPEQRAHLRLQWAGLETKIAGGNRLVVEGWVHPHPLCRRYRVRISYRLRQAPRVTALEPALRRRSDDEAIPHTFDEREGPRPCLYYQYQWNSGMRLAETIVPWLLEWLIFYELWHTTGTWYGGGVDHGPKDGSEG